MSLLQIKFGNIIKNRKAKNLARVNGLVKSLKEISKFKAYINIIQAQTKEGIVEKLSEVCEIKVAGSEQISETDKILGSNKVFYLPHKAVVREIAKITKLRIVYDVSS